MSGLVWFGMARISSAKLSIKNAFSFIMEIRRGAAVLLVIRKVTNTNSDGIPTSHPAGWHHYRMKEREWKETDTLALC